MKSWEMINEISSKDGYLRQQWLLEQERIVDQKKNFHQFLNDLKSTSDQRTKSCEKCFHSISKFYSKQIFGMYEKNEHVKEEYNQTLCPLQYLSAFLCLMNNCLILIIFKKSLQFYFLSNILLILCLYAKFFLPDEPNVNYTLFIGWSIVVFTIYLLMKVFSTLLIIEHYQLMDHLRNNDQ